MKMTFIDRALRDGFYFGNMTSELRDYMRQLHEKEPDFAQQKHIRNRVEHFRKDLHRLMETYSGSPAAGSYVLDVEKLIESVDDTLRSYAVLQRAEMVGEREVT